GVEVHELRQDRDEERDGLRVGDAHDEPLGELAPVRAGWCVAVDGGRGIRSMSDRLDAEVHEVERAGELDDREDHDRLGDERADPERDRRDEGHHAERVADDAEQAAQAPERERPPDHEQHARTGDDDEHHGCGDERPEVLDWDHPSMLLRAPCVSITSYIRCYVKSRSHAPGCSVAPRPQEEDRWSTTSWSNWA